jgi:CRISPR-associated protein Csb1
MSETRNLTLEMLQNAVIGTAAAFRCVTEYQPAGGPGDKVFPPTYEGGKYATEDRWIDGQKVPCVLLDSVQSQANRMELALLDAVEDGHLDLPRLVVEFKGPGLLKPLRVTSLEAPHRAADAIFRDSEIDGVKFRESDRGKALDKADVRNAAPLFGLCPTALVFGLWDSTGPRGGLGGKFQRAVVSEMVGLNAVPGVKTASRIDPLEILKGSATVYEATDGWTLDPAQALKTDKGKPKTKGKDGKPSEINHGNVTPDIAFARVRNGNVIFDTKVDEFGVERRFPRLVGGFTVSKAIQTTVLSLASLRRLRFPLNGDSKAAPAVNQAARVALAAIGLAGASLARAQGADLRSRCQLFPTGAFVWELLDDPTAEPLRFSLSPKTAVGLAKDAIGEAKKLKLPWEGEVRLTPSANLLELLRRSQQLAATSGEGGE